MRRDLVGAARFLVLPTVVLSGLAISAPGRLELGVRIYALLLCTTGIALLSLALRRAYPTETALRESARPTPQPTPPHELGRIEREVALGIAGSFDLHYRLAPRLRSLAAGLLSTRRKISMTADPGSARVVLGDEAWGLVRPDRPRPQERLGKGIPPEELNRVVDALEAI